jgi:hypothetical protein
MRTFLQIEPECGAAFNEWLARFHPTYVNPKDRQRKEEIISLRLGFEGAWAKVNGGDVMNRYEAYMEGKLP